MKIQQAMAFIHNEKWRGSKPGLSRTQALLTKLGNPEKGLRFVHVAGTNGKGSTAACIESILRQSGYQTGLYTSPYILEFGERMRVNGENISSDKLCRLVEEVAPAAESLWDSPTEFELVTAMAFLYFAQSGCEIVVLEVGLGGETDATNVIDCPEAAVVASIALDHTAELGTTLAEIARAKAGIIKAGCKVITMGGCPEADGVIEAVCREKQAKLTTVKRDTLRTEGVSLSGNRFTYDGMEHLNIPLAGTYQPENGALAVETARALQTDFPRITEETIRQGLAQVRWPGRFEILRQEKPVIVLDGGHNPHGVKATVQSLQAQFPGEKIHFLMGVMADKDVTQILELLLPVAADFVTVTPENPRAMSAEALAAAIRTLGGQAVSCGEIADGTRLALEKTGKTGVLCALGTLYFSGDVRKSLQRLGQTDKKIR